MGKFIGRKGENIERLKRDSMGADIQLDQSTKESGYSQCYIIGTPEQQQRCKKIVESALVDIAGTKP